MWDSYFGFIYQYYAYCDSMNYQYPIIGQSSDITVEGVAMSHSELSPSRRDLDDKSTLAMLSSA
jgi:hypothetical protein